jgi:hypothetical protein
MARTTNPFEDNFDDIRNTNRPATTSITNPFDDDTTNNISDGAVPSGDISRNPFDPARGNLRFDDQVDGNNDVGEDETYETMDEENVVGAPIEASWQYLGDLPYRRIPIYSNVRWGGSLIEHRGENDHENQSRLDTDFLKYGLSAFPKAALQRQPDLLDARELQELLNTSTVTKVVGCQYGGPVAVVTLPIVGETSWFSHTDIRILTNSGHLLATIEFPLPEFEQNYSPCDIMEVGFTDRAILVIILKDSLCFTYDLAGGVLLPPFFILPHGEGQGTKLFQACIFEGGAVRFDFLISGFYFP